MLNIKRLKPARYALLFLLAFLCQYGIEHAMYLLRDAVYSGSVVMTAAALSAISAVAGYVVNALEILILAVGAFVTLTVYLEGGVRLALMTGGIITLCRLAYLIPHYYMTLFSMGFDTAEALLFLLPLSIFIMAVYYGEIALAAVLAMLPSARRSREEFGDRRTILASSYTTVDIFDIGNPLTASVAIISLTALIKPIINSIVNTVTLVADRGPAFAIGDAYSIIFEFIFLIIIFMLSHLLLFAIKRAILRPSGSDGADNAKEEDSCATEDDQATVGAGSSIGHAEEDASDISPETEITEIIENNSKED